MARRNAAAKRAREEQRPERDPLVFERRSWDREPKAGVAMGAFYDAFGDMSLSPVRIVDSSPVSVGIVCDLPAAPGSRVTLYGDNLPTPRVCGTVARCQRQGEGYRIGVRCDGDRAA